MCNIRNKQCPVVKQKFGGTFPMFRTPVSWHYFLVLGVISLSPSPPVKTCARSPNHPCFPLFTGYHFSFASQFNQLFVFPILCEYFSFCYLHNNSFSMSLFWFLFPAAAWCSQLYYYAITMVSSFQLSSQFRLDLSTSGAF